MVGQINHHLYRKRGFYYFCRRVPKALLEHYPKPRIVVALKTRACNANSASAAINKWLKPRVPDGCVVHSFRHSLRDRLRRVECSSDIADAIGGWATAGVGQKYGSGYGLEIKTKWMERIVVRAPRTDNHDV